MNFPVGASAMLFGSYYIEGYGWGPNAPNRGQLHPIKDTYAVLREMTPLILAHQGNQSMTGFFQVSDDDQFTQALGGYVITMTGTHPVYGQGKSAGASEFLHGNVPGGAMVIALHPDEFVIVGRGLNISFAQSSGQPTRLITCSRGRYTKGRWREDTKPKGREPRAILANNDIETFRLRLAK
jgi:hypothetical protein